MPMNPKDVMKWSAADWSQKVKHARPSGGGAVGVMFIWCRNPGSDGANYNDVSTSDFVLKPVAGSAAPAKFAEKFMSSVIGAKTVNTQGIPRSDRKFPAVLDVLAKFKNALVMSEAYEISLTTNQKVTVTKHVLSNPKTGVIRGATTAQRTFMSDKDKALLERWRKVWNNYEQAGTFLVQSLAKDQIELGDVYKDTTNPDGIKNFLGDKTLMINLGRLFAVDAALGNGDRLASPNSGNILYSSKGEIWAIDSQTILQNFQEMKSASERGFSQFNSSDGLGSAKPEDFGRALKEGTYGQMPARSHKDPDGVTLAPDFAMKHFYDVDKWWNLWFRAMLEEKGHNNHQTAPTENEWSQAKAWFRQGVETGLKEVDSHLSGFNWLSVKSKFKKYERRYGSDLNMDWTNFKIRRVYIKAIRAYPKDPDKAISAVNAYAKKKLNVEGKV